VRTVAVLGAGAGGAAAVAELCVHGHRVRLWNRSPETIEPFQQSGAVRYEGVLGAGEARPELITTDLAAAVADADIALVCLPALAHEDLAEALARLDPCPRLVLNPGHTGGALHFRRVFLEVCGSVPELAEFSTLTYVARKYAPDTVNISGVAERVRAACLPGGEDALAIARELYPVAVPQRDVLAPDLANVNLVLHPPGAILGAAWVEATAGNYLFYAEGVTPGVARVIAALDAERLAVARAFGHELDPLHLEMAAIGTADRDAAGRNELGNAIRAGAANARIRAPDSFRHRYYLEDFGYGLVPLLAFARIAAVDVPVAAALLALAGTLLERDLEGEGLNASRLGIVGLDRMGLLELLAGTRAPA
jgi:opine dehydrogenase